MFKLLHALSKIGLLSPSGFLRFVSSIFRYGVNLMALLSFARKVYGSNTALVDEKETLSYDELFAQSEKLSVFLSERYKIGKGRKAAFLCKNHVSLVKVIFAVSRLGADIYLLNAEMSRSQFQKLLEHYGFDFIVYDEHLKAFLEESDYKKDKILSYHDTSLAINNLPDSTADDGKKLKRTSLGKIVILTGGTTGNFKTAVHKPSTVNFLNPYLAMLTRLKLANSNTAYIAVPIYHGYGLAVLFLFISLGKKILIRSGFNTETACSLIREQHADTVVVVPLMLRKMLNDNTEDLRSLKCIASGGAELNAKLAVETQNLLGGVLYNLYGTSEGGLSTIATPQDLRYSSHTIGRKIQGLRLKILDGKGKEVKSGKIGGFYVKNKWSMRNRKASWISTGDLGYRDQNGYYFLCGRTDDMIVSAGENVYPAEVEQILASHPQVRDAAVIAVRDENFGQRLKAFILPCENSAISKDELHEWLRSRVARYQIPKDIVIVASMPYTPLGKLDRKQLIQ